MSAFF